MKVIKSLVLDLDPSDVEQVPVGAVRLTRAESMLVLKLMRTAARESEAEETGTGE